MDEPLVFISYDSIAIVVWIKSSSEKQLSDIKVSLVCDGHDDGDQDCLSINKVTFEESSHIPKDKFFIGTTYFALNDRVRGNDDCSLVIRGGGMKERVIRIFVPK